MRSVELERMHEAEARHFWFVGTRRVIVDVLRRALGSVLDDDRASPGGGPRVLDVGCGTGYTLTRLPAGVRAFAVDGSNDALRLASRRGPSASLLRASALDLPFRPGSFEAVLALDVLEHLDDDGAGAREIARVLRRGGVAVVTVPAFTWLWSEHDEALDHRRRYRLATLVAVLEAAGLRIEKRSYYNFWLFPVSVLARLLGRLAGWLRRSPGARSTNLGVPPAPLNRLLTAVLGSERWLLRRLRLPFGLSCLAVGRKVN